MGHRVGRHAPGIPSWCAQGPDQEVLADCTRESTRRRGRSCLAADGCAGSSLAFSEPAPCVIIAPCRSNSSSRENPRRRSGRRHPVLARTLQRTIPPPASTGRRRRRRLLRGGMRTFSTLPQAPRPSAGHQPLQRLWRNGSPCPGMVRAPGPRQPLARGLVVGAPFHQGRRFRLGHDLRATSPFGAKDRVPGADPGTRATPPFLGCGHVRGAPETRFSVAMA